MKDKTQNKQNELKTAKKRIKDLEKELNRKDKALAEMAAILALKKTEHCFRGPRGRLIEPEEKQGIIQLIQETVSQGALQR